MAEQIAIEQVMETAQQKVVEQVVRESCAAAPSIPSSLHPVESLFGHKAAVFAGVFVVVLVAAIAATLFAIYRRTVWKEGKIGVFVPLFVYDVLAAAFFPFSFLVSSLMLLQPTESEWNNQNNFIFNGPEVLRAKAGSVQETLAFKKEIIAGSDKVYSEIELVRLFDSLPVCKSSALMGRAFEGKILRTNRNLLDVVQVFAGLVLKLLGISWGRRFLSHHRGDPVVLNIRNRLFLPIAIFGNMSIETITWREVSTAAGRFNSLPWTDYFRVLHEGGGSLVLLGCWTNREKTGGWFTLTLNKSWPLASTAPFS